MTPAELDRTIVELSGRIAHQLDEQTRSDLHDFVVALACNSNVEQTGTWLFRLMRALKPMANVEDEER